MLRHRHQAALGVLFLACSVSAWLGAVDGLGMCVRRFDGTLDEFAIS